ncbi:hypothetical protein CR513_44539, partial [Mucuna pruriens]
EIRYHYAKCNDLNYSHKQCESSLVQIEHGEVESSVCRMVPLSSEPRKKAYKAFRSCINNLDVNVNMEVKSTYMEELPNLETQWFHNALMNANHTICNGATKFIPTLKCTCANHTCFCMPFNPKTKVNVDLYPLIHDLQQLWSFGPMTYLFGWEHRANCHVAQTIRCAICHNFEMLRPRGLEPKTRPIKLASTRTSLVIAFTLTSVTL